MQVIDYFSLDIEGAELMAMSSFPWDKHSINVLTVERPSFELHGMLYDNGLRCGPCLGFTSRVDTQMQQLHPLS